MITTMLIEMMLTHAPAEIDAGAETIPDADAHPWEEALDNINALGLMMGLSCEATPVEDDLDKHAIRAAD